jgi:hypothetical protein
MRQLTESKWESGVSYIETSNVSRYVVHKSGDYEYVLIKLDGRVYRLIYHNGETHVCSTY